MREEGKEGGSRQRTSQSTEHKRWSAQEPHVMALRHITPRDFVEILSCRFIVYSQAPIFWGSLGLCWWNFHKQGLGKIIARLAMLGYRFSILLDLCSSLLGSGTVGNAKDWVRDSFDFAKFPLCKQSGLYCLIRSSCTLMNTELSFSVEMVFIDVYSLASLPMLQITLRSELFISIYSHFADEKIGALL